MIVKDDSEVEDLKRCLDNIGKYVQDCYITGTNKPDEKIQALAKEYNAHYSYFQWTKDFSAARNFNMSQCKNEWLIWLDCDDVVTNPQLLPEIKLRAEQLGADAVFLDYLYQCEFNPDGSVRNVLIHHLRERLVRNNGTFKWIARVHETLIQQREAKLIEDKRMVVIHYTQAEDMQKAIYRNIDILENEMEDELKNNKYDPRTVYYLGKAYFDLRNDENYRKSEKLLWDYIYGPLRPDPNDPTRVVRDSKFASGWDEERAQAWEYLAEIARIYGKHKESIEIIHNSLKENDKFPSAYINMAITYMMLKDWDRAIRWIKLSASIPDPMTTLVQNPRDLEARSYEVLFNSYLNTNQLDKAKEAIYQIKKLFPDAQSVQERVDFIDGLVQQRDLTEAIVKLTQRLSANPQERYKLKTLMSSVPSDIAYNPIISNIRNQVMPPKVWGDKDIAIFCGAGFEVWNGKTIKERGSGGSEEAVYYLSKELAKLGWKVTVYADPGEEIGLHDGVDWRNYFEFNTSDVFNILIGWRNVHLFKNPIKALRKYLWLHDIPNMMDYIDPKTQQMYPHVKGIDKIIPLSMAHRNMIKQISDEKIMVSTNGIVLKDIEKVKEKKDNHKCIWTSSYDRGLEHLLKIWPDVLKEVPDATLEIMYGTKLFDQFYANNPERMAWKTKVFEMMKQKGITHHDRVGQEEILK